MPWRRAVKERRGASRMRRHRAVRREGLYDD